MAARDRFAHYSNGFRELRHTELARFARRRKGKTLVERARVAVADARGGTITGPRASDRGEEGGASGK
jgi:hypothetical protein